MNCSGVYTECSVPWTLYIETVPGPEKNHFLSSCFFQTKNLLIFMNEAFGDEYLMWRINVESYIITTRRERPGERGGVRYVKNQCMKRLFLGEGYFLLHLCLLSVPSIDHLEMGSDDKLHTIKFHILQSLTKNVFLKIYYIQSDMFSMFKYSTTHKCVIRREGVTCRSFTHVTLIILQAFPLDKSTSFTL